VTAVALSAPFGSVERMFEDVVEVRGRLAVLVDRLDPDAVSATRARELWAEFDKVERLGAAGKTLLARRLAATHRPATAGAKTPAEDLARQAGTSTGAAQDAVNTSNRLPEQPKLEQALRGGQLSPAQAGLVSSAAAANPAAETRLVELAARVSVGELREECARVRAAADPDPEATNRRLHARRLRRWTDPEGFWTLHATGTPQAGAAFNTALQPIIDTLYRDAHRAGRREPVAAYAFDALIHLVEHATGRCDCRVAETASDPAGDPETGGEDGREAGTDNTAGPAAASGDDHTAADGHDAASATTRFGDAAADSSGRPVADLLGRAPTRSVGYAGPAGATAGEPGIFAAAPQPQPTQATSCGVRPRAAVNPRYLALLRVDVQALRRGGVQGQELCEIAGVGPVPVSIARGLLGEAIVKLVITRGVDVLNVTHLGRGPTAAQRAALLWTNPTCSVLGCNRARIENDHREPWAQTHWTRLDELDPLCVFHHDLKTRLGWALVAGKGKRGFVPPDDPRHPAYRKPRAHRPSRDGGASARPPNRSDAKPRRSAEPAQQQLPTWSAESPRAP
jgi:hypothetical protein